MPGTPVNHPRGAEGPRRGIAPRQGGFSLIEMIVVVAILLILLALLTPTLTSALERARMVACLTNLSELHRAAMAYTDEREGLLPSSDGRPWLMPSDDLWEHPDYRWNHHLFSTLIQQGFVQRPPLTDDPSQMPANRARTIFRCPSGTWEIGAFTPNVFNDPGAYGAWMASLNVDGQPHGWSQHEPTCTYHFFPSWYGVNGDTWQVGRVPYARNAPETGHARPFRTTLDRIPEPSSIISMTDGVWQYNRVSTRVVARHMGGTMTGTVMMDGHARAFRREELPGLGDRDPARYPRFAF